MKLTLPRKLSIFPTCLAAGSFCTAVFLFGIAQNTEAAAVQTKVVKSVDGFQLQRSGKPYFIKGGGGGGSKELLAQCGGNSFRTWGVGPDTLGQLDEAQKLGLSVALGIWLPHKFNWSDPNGVKGVIDKVRQAVTQYKDHPAVLCWSIGNEMEVEGKDTPELWKAVNEMAKLAHQLDPNHPTMTVIAEMGGTKLENIKSYCPEIDIVGINTYAGGPSAGDRFKKADVGKPYVITEFGPPGTWETGRTAFGAALELTSTEKAKKYAETYEKSVAGQKSLCLGSYAFTWGFKREATATWFGLLLPDNATKLNAVDALTELWSGKPPAHRCPDISKITLLTPDQTNGGDTLKASIQATDPQNAPLTIEWVLAKEMSTYAVTGTGAAATADYSKGIVKNGMPEVEIKLPTEPGVYRVYCYVKNKFASAALASTSIKIK
ncbi:MAG: glycoside hydrolase family 2 TIM barrel-domain containing protein [Verrucomicrobiota bacterium]